MIKKISNFFVYFLCLLVLSSGGFFCRPDSSSASLADKPLWGRASLLVVFKDSLAPRVVDVPAGVDPEAFLSAYQSRSDVLYAENNSTVKMTVIPSDPFYNKQWYLDKIRAPLAWDKIRETPKVVIAVIDSGIQISHPDLYPNLWQNIREVPGNGLDDDNNGFIDDYNGWDFIDNIPDPSPKFEDGFTEAGIMHGTLVSGIIAAVGNNGSGVSGVSWNARVMPLRVLNDRGEGRVSEVIRAIDYAINNGANIINFSFVGLDYSRGLYEAVKRAHDAGVLMVAAAGNEQSQGEGYDLDETPMYPACDDGEDNMVIGVAAVDAVDQKAPFSSYGYKCVDVSAPGVSFYGLAVFKPTEKLGDSFLDQYFGGYWSGTSMAAPVVAGALALVEGVNPGAKASEIQEAILATADDTNRLNPKYVGRLGRGRLNIWSAIEVSELQRREKSVKVVVSPASAFVSEIREFESEGALVKKFKAMPDNFRGGANITAGDVDGDRNEEIIIGAGPGDGPKVRIFDKNGVLKSEFLAFTKTFRGGVKVAAGDFDNDGLAEIVASPAGSLEPQVKIFDSRGRLRGQFLAYDKNFRGGVNLAVGDVDADNHPEIVTGPGAGGGPQVKIFDSRGKLEGQFFAYDKNFRGGVNIALADIDGGAIRSKKEIVTGPGKGGGPHVRIFDNQGSVLGQFFAYEKNFRGGVFVAGGDIDGDGLSEIITGAGASGGPHARVFKKTGELVSSFYAYDGNMNGGVNVTTIVIKN